MTQSAKPKAVVLDATAFYAGVPYVGLECYKTTAEVLKEVTHNTKYLAIINTLIESKRLEVEEPSEEDYRQVLAAAAETKDLSNLSEADISILALALHYSKERESVLVTDDYAVQNVAQTLSIPFASALSRGIRRHVKWMHFCPACGQSYIVGIRYCPICGTALKRRFRSSKEIKY